jgi:hypothetical protein
LRANLKLGRNRAGHQGLRICIADDKLNILDALVKHVIDGVAATTTHTNHLDDRLVVLGECRMNKNYQS